MKLQRLLDRPLIHAGLHPSLGNNINGPSLIATPEWLPGRLGRYYLYFAHHTGRHLRLAHANDLRGPWTMHAPGVLPVEQSTCTDHVASPDVWIDHANRCVRLCFHGVAFPPGIATDGHEAQFGAASRWVGNQRSKMAESADGLHFTADPRPIGASYLRSFEWQGRWHGLAMPGMLYRTDRPFAEGPGDTPVENGPLLFDARFRHAALLRRGHLLHVFFTNAGDAPESILHTTIDLRPHWHDWRPGAVQTLLAPSLPWEGADLPPEPSARGPVYTPARQLRDPAVFVDYDQRVYLLYAGGGEQGIGIAALHHD